MIRTLTLAALLSFLAHTVNAEVDLRVEISTNATSVATGGSITFNAIVRNVGTTPSPAVSVTLGVDHGRIVSTSAPGCRLESGSLLQCAFSALNGGESRFFAFTGRASNALGDVGQQLAGRITLSTVIPDDQPVFVSAQARVPITMSPALIDLAVAFAVPTGGPQPLRTFETILGVHNGGPAPAGPVAVTVVYQTSPVTIIGADEPWTCSGSSGLGTTVICTTPRIGAGETLTLALRVDVAVARTYTISAKAWADDATDTNGANDAATFELPIGVASDFARILVPLLVNETPGARATWTSELWALSRNEAVTLLLCRESCPTEGSQGSRPGRDSTERLWPFGGPAAAPHGAMLYIEKDLAPQTTFTSRLFSSRSSPARGVELPIVRESQFRADRVILPTVVLDASHRFKLRIYDPDATPNNGVIVRLFDHEVSRTLAERTLVLNTRLESVLHIAALNGYPGYAEIDDIFTGFIPATDAREVGVEIISLRPGTRLWAFVSATENEGEHVTLVSPQ